MSDALPFTSSALRKWGHRFANQGVQGLVDRPRPGRPPVFYKIVPHLEPEGLRQYIHQVIALLSPTNKEGVIGADRSGLHRAKKLASTLTPWHEQLRWPLLPAHWGPPRKPIEGFWRGLKGKSGAGRCLPALHQLYQRMRRVLMEHQARPIYAFPW